MADDTPQFLAKSMIDMYGRDAAKIAKEYAVKHKLSGDANNHAVWLCVAELIEKPITELDA